MKANKIARWLYSLHWYYYWPLKVLLFIILVLIVLFPRLDLFPKHVRRYVDPNTLINPHSTELSKIIKEFEVMRDPSWSRSQLMDNIEKFVIHKIRYAWDWELWGNADYFPTVEEIIREGKEDCDGRAILAASILRRYGFDSILVTDLQHLWVKTDIGETMGPGKKKAVQYTEEGIILDWSVVWDIPNIFCYGASVFPLKRELIITLGLWLFLIGRNVRFKNAFIWLALLTVGLMFIREGGDWTNPDRIMNWSGLLIILSSIAALILQSYYASKRFEMNSETKV